MASAMRSGGMPVREPGGFTGMPKPSKMTPSTGQMLAHWGYGMVAVALGASRGVDDEVRLRGVDGLARAQGLAGPAVDAAFDDFVCHAVAPTLAGAQADRAVALVVASSRPLLAISR